MVRDLPNSRRELEFLLESLNKYIKGAKKLIFLRREANTQILRAMDRAKRGLNPCPWQSQGKSKKPKVPDLPPFEADSLLEVAPDVIAAMQNFNTVEHEMETVIGSGKNDVDTLKRIIDLNNSATTCGLIVLRPFEDLRTRIMHKLDEIDGKMSKGSHSKRMKVDVANQKAQELAKADPEWARKPNVRQWADDIGCSVGLVEKLPFYQSCAEKAGTRRKGAIKANVVSLSNELQQTVGEGDRDEVLNQLIAEQKADHEPSPLESDRPDAPRKIVRHYRRL